MSSLSPVTHNPRCQWRCGSTKCCPPAESCSGGGPGSAPLLSLSFSTWDRQLSWEDHPFSTLFSKPLLLLFPCVFCRLDNNQFKDDVMELLGSVLSRKDCQIQRLR